jgi:hypothetical protein
MAAKNGIFEVDSKGLRRQAMQRGLPALLKELVQNVLDEQTRNAAVTVEPTDIRGQYLIVVTDDSPDGFANLADSYTMFAESKKRGDAEKRGFMNIGEKYVIAACLWATIISTKGGYRFDVEEGTRTAIKDRRPAGTEFRGVIRTNKDEVEDALNEIRRVIVPEGVTLTVNGAPVLSRTPLVEVTPVPSLPTLLPNEDNVMKEVRRKPRYIRIYRPLPGEKGTVFDQGMPVVVLGDTFDVDIGQRVPVGQDRDNLPVPFLRELRGIVTAATASLLTEEDAGRTWVREGIGSGKVEPEVVHDILVTRFGTEHIATRNPRDPEANARFIAAHPDGVVVSGGALSKSEWAFVNEHQILRPTNFYTPTPGHSDDTGGYEEVEVIDRVKWTAGMLRVEAFVKWFAKETLGIDVDIQMVLAPKADFMADYANMLHRMRFNVSHCGYAWFDRPLDGSDAYRGTHGLLATINHELAHQTESNHLSDRFTHAESDLGAKAVTLAIKYPERFMVGSEVAAAALTK